MTNIILLSDGTGNAAGKVWRTNVWRLFQCLDLKNSGQIAVYDDGVGTSSFKPLAILGGVFGWGLKRNVLNLYKFLCRNYRPGDRVYAFGFSRGAFTIRVVCGLILDQGLVQFENEADLDRKVRAAYRAYRHEKYSVWNLQFPFRLLHFLLDKRFYTPRQTFVPNIDFVGVWDTVAAYGLPIDEMTRGVSQWLWPLELPNRDFNPRVLKARHAVAVDDERATFHPVLWNEDGTNTQPSGAVRSTSHEQLLQVWFSGVHSNVGGGYPDDSLANVSLAWMMAEAKSAGLSFKDMPNADPDALLSTDSAKDKDGRLYDSRSGLGGYYRYSPRKIADFYEAMPASKNENPPLPKIFLQTGQKYLIAVKRVPTSNDPPMAGYPLFFDRSTFMGGQPTSSLSPLQMVTMTLLYPFRHTFDRPWGSVILRIGSRGNEESFLDRNPPKQIDDPFVNDTAKVVIDGSEMFSEVHTAKRDGELFIYLNKPMLGLWGYEIMIANWIGDTGQAKVTIDRR